MDNTFFLFKEYVNKNGVVCLLCVKGEFEELNLTGAGFLEDRGV